MSKELNQALTTRLMTELGELLDNSEMLEVIAPIVPSIVDLAMREGEDRATELLSGIVSDDTSYAAWQLLIESSTPENRILIMETTRQAAIKEMLLEIEDNERTKEWFVAFFKLLSVVVPLLL